jgi:DNA-binding CsgD family transcriptional regulator
MFRTEEEEALKSERTIRLVGTGLINLELAMRSLGISTGTIWQLEKITRGKLGLVPTSLF